MATHTLLLRGRRWMLFVDGENFTKRGQDLLDKAGVEAAPPVWHRDVYLWFPDREATTALFAPNEGPFLRRTNEPAPPDRVQRASRAYYYTCSESDEPEQTTIRLNLRELGFEPRLFKRRRGRSKAVDIALATEVLTLGSEGRYEVAVIVAGDGDYVPLVEAVKRLGLYVVLAFFSTQGAGLSPELRIAADNFVELDERLISEWQRYSAHKAE